MTLLPDDLAGRFGEIADCLAFLTGAEPSVESIVDEWCDRQEADHTVAMVLNARRMAREAREAPPVTVEKKPKVRVEKRAKDRAPVGEHVCPECGFVAAAANGLGTHRARKHGVRGATVPGDGSGGEYVCPVDGCGFSTARPQGLASHMRRHPPAAPEVEREPFVIPIPGFDGQHRLAHERRVGREVDAYCACGESSGVTDREDARAWLHQHIEEAAA